MAWCYLEVTGFLFLTFFSQSIGLNAKIVTKKQIIRLKEKVYDL
ncbi:hypothetical protein P700755_004013 [Psychroflexus torquis ATCC 700755]|uniref:Uncharacterized protein n=1 Tax=Psychroflexus torquis (strain ATCC 700755 / CIP 106069 / ACAM 623) TaxID=313595 RepID=K4IYM7_PSYTT|nr:hypothetical protein P700755_004013 [Psychroflexus torquis ATCC 700755]